MNEPNQNRRTLLEYIAEKYYIKGMSQEEIAQDVSMSRSNISKLLRLCISEHIVEFKINYANSQRASLENALQHKFNLKKVIVVPSDTHEETCKISIGQYAAGYLESTIQSGMLVGISWGSTLYHVVKNFCPRDSICADVIQMLGGNSSVSVDTDGQELARNMAQALNGKANILHVPMLVQSRVLKNLLLDEPNVVEHFKMFDRIDLAVIGIGSSKPEISAVYRSGSISKEDAENFVKLGVVGDLCGRQIDINGNPCQTNISERIIGIGLDQLKNIETVIGVVSGIEKAEATLGCLRGSYINVLVADENLATYVLRNN